MALSKALARIAALHLRSTPSKILVGVMLALSFSAIRMPVQSAPATEYQVKAVFLFNFAQFVEWPPGEGSAPLVIGVLGQDPFGGYLDQTVRGERVNGRPLIVQRYHRVEDIRSCHVLFISRSESDRLDQIISSLKYRRILTVCDSTSGRGVIIRLVTEQNKVKLRINVEAAKAANLTISSKLLRLAQLGA